MSNIESTIAIVNRNIKDVFQFLSLPANYEFLMPDRVRSFTCDEDSATLDIEGLGKIKLVFEEKRAFNYIRMVPVQPVPVDFYIEWKLRELGDKTEVQAFIDAKLNVFMKPIVEPVMRNLLNTQVERLRNRMLE